MEKTFVFKNYNYAFFTIAKHTLNNNGVVFGTTLTKDYSLEIKYVDDIQYLDCFIKPKYILPDIKNTFKECKDFLESGRLVLFSGIYKITQKLVCYLKKSYDNLIILNIDQCNLNDFNVSSKLNNLNNFADLIIVDFLSTNNAVKPISNNEINIKNKEYALIFKTPKAEMLLNQLKSSNLIRVKNVNESLYSKLYWKKLKVKQYLLPIKNNVLKNNRNYGVITLTFHKNYGGILQNYALQQIINSFGYGCISINAQVNYASSLSFIKKFINQYNLGTYKHKVKVPYYKMPKNICDGIVVGSDQVWQKKWNDIYNVFLSFAKLWKINKITYGASIGVDFWDFTKDETIFIKKSINSFNAISTRELDLKKAVNNVLNTECSNVLDPTLLLTSNDYSLLCEKINKKQGFFYYILDKNDEKQNIINKSKKIFNLNEIQISDSVEEWIAAFRDAEFIITDSYHGCLFSLIFNKPFVCIVNKVRGISRFNTIKELFNIQNRLIDSTSSFDFSLLQTKPNCLAKIKSLSYESKKWLYNNLKCEPKKITLKNYFEYLYILKNRRKISTSFQKKDLIFLKFLRFSKSIIKNS